MRRIPLLAWLLLAGPAPAVRAFHHPSTLPSARQRRHRTAGRARRVPRPSPVRPPASSESNVHNDAPPPPPAAAARELAQVDVLYNRRTPLVYDAGLDRYVPRSGAANPHRDDDHRGDADWPPPRQGRSFLRHTLLPGLSVAFLPQSVTPNYYRFIRWRVAQRFVNANLHVLGTQSLLLGLGLSAAPGGNNRLALSAALNWVLKDALGKIVRMLWAARMGRRFDSDAKKWRFRSACSYALGNALEITTFLVPGYFLLWATLANACKQVSMLTSSSTRTAIYNSFRNGTDNIGDITAKGEAQIAVVDLLGIASGVALSRALGADPRAVLAAYGALQAAELRCMHRQLRAVQYRVVNFERLVRVATAFCGALEDGAAAPPEGGPDSRRVDRASVPTPQEVAAGEQLFLRPAPAARRQVAFGSLERSRLSPQELGRLLGIFRGERFLLVVGRNRKQRHHRPWRRFRASDQASDEREWTNGCHIVLHEAATNLDIVKSTLALVLLRRRLAASGLDPLTARSADCLDLIERSLRQADESFPQLLRQMAMASWESPARSMFGKVHMRADWPLDATDRSRSHGARSGDRIQQGDESAVK